MSVDLLVYLNDNRLPTHDEWQAAIDKAGLNLILNEFDPREHWGFLPCRLNETECGFEYSFQPLEEQDEEIRDVIGDRDRAVIMVMHGGLMADIEAAMFAAAVLTEISNGVFCDAQSGEFATGNGVFDLIRQQEEAARERGRRAAEKDASITDQRCPHCGAPCPSYRKSCKACGKAVG